MNFIWAVFKRELKSYFVSPLAYTAIAVFLILQGALFLASLNSYNSMRIRAAQNPLVEVPGVEDIIRSFYGTDIIYALVLIVPLLTMRLLADERRQHTAELLLTAPMSTRQLVTAKFLGAVFLLVVMLVLSLWMPVVLTVWGDADSAVIYTGLLGAFFYGAFLLAGGLLASSTTESPFVAAILALLFVLVVIVLGPQVASLPVIGEDLDRFTPVTNLGTLSQGVIDSHAIVYFLSVIIFVLDLTARVVDSQRWR